MNEMITKEMRNISALQLFELPNELDFECIVTSACGSNQRSVKQQQPCPASDRANILIVKITVHSPIRCAAISGFRANSAFESAGRMLHPHTR